MRNARLAFRPAAPGEPQSWLASCAIFANTVVQLGILRYEFGKEFGKDSLILPNSP